MLGNFRACVNRPLHDLVGKDHPTQLPVRVVIQWHALNHFLTIRLDNVPSVGGSLDIAHSSHQASQNLRVFQADENIHHPLFAVHAEFCTVFDDDRFLDEIARSSDAARIIHCVHAFHDGHHPVDFQRRVSDRRSGQAQHTGTMVTTDQPSLAHHVHGFLGCRRQ